MSDSDNEGYDSGEVDEACEEAKVGLQDGTVTCLNSDGTFRCPFSPGRKKQAYKYHEILQHADGVGKGNRGPEVVGKHRALTAYLKHEMAEKAQPHAERTVHLQQRIPSRVDRDDRKVYPWMGILQNIDNHTHMPGDGFRIGAGAADIKENLKAFHPESVKVFYDVKGHQGVAVVEFRNTIDGFKDAEAFENSFYYKGRGRKDYQKDYPNRCGTHLYGWMATQKDVEGGNNLVVDHLKSSGDLKSLLDTVKELDVISEKQVQDLKEVVIKKERVMEVTVKENWGLTNKVDKATAQREQAEQEKQKLIHDHKKELEDLQQVAQFKAEEHEKNMRIHRSQIESRMRELEIKNSELETLKSVNEAEKAEKQETERLLAWYKGQAQQQEDQEIKHRDLIKKHQEENKILEKKLQQQRKKLQEKQRRELESQQVIEQLLTEKSKKAEIVEAKKEETDTEKEDYVKRISELEGKLEELKEEADDADETVKILTISQRQVNDEVEEARSVILESKMLTKKKYGTSEIGVKRLGALNTEGWYEVCKDKFKSSYAFQMWASNLENMLTKHDFNPPLKTVPDGNAGKMKYAVDEANETLTQLRNKYGPVVANAFGAAALEIETSNPSGRYPVPTLWDFKANKKASMSQIFQHIVNVLLAKEQEVKEKDSQIQGLLITSKNTPTPALKKRRT